MAEVGMGCAILPAFTVCQEVETGRLTQKNWFSSEMPVRVLALSRRNRTRLRSLDAFLSLFKATESHVG
jgi:DNA-binding transcriptional LysR family regulator